MHRDVPTALFYGYFLDNITSEPYFKLTVVFINSIYRSVRLSFLARIFPPNAPKCSVLEYKKILIRATELILNTRVHVHVQGLKAKDTRNAK